jgi:hypothetical protein
VTVEVSNLGHVRIVMRKTNRWNRGSPLFLKQIHIPKLSACENTTNALTNALTKGAVPLNAPLKRPKATPQKNGNIT